jgi:hypothetical protein
LYILDDIGDSFVLAPDIAAAKIGEFPTTPLPLAISVRAMNGIKLCTFKVGKLKYIFIKVLKLFK